MSSKTSGFEVMFKFKGLAPLDVEDASRSMKNRIIEELGLACSGPAPLPRYRGEFTTNPKRINDPNATVIKNAKIFVRIIVAKGVLAEHMAEMSEWSFPDSVKINIRTRRSSKESWDASRMNHRSRNNDKAKQVETS